MYVISVSPYLPQHAHAHTHTHTHTTTLLKFDNLLVDSSVSSRGGSTLRLLVLFISVLKLTDKIDLQSLILITSLHVCDPTFLLRYIYTSNSMGISVISSLITSPIPTKYVK